MSLTLDQLDADELAIVAAIYRCEHDPYQCPRFAAGGVRRIENGRAKRVSPVAMFLIRALRVAGRRLRESVVNSDSKRVEDILATLCDLGVVQRAKGNSVPDAVESIIGPDAVLRVDFDCSRVEVAKPKGDWRFIHEDTEFRDIGLLPSDEQDTDPRKHGCPGGAAGGEFGV